MVHAPIIIQSNSDFTSANGVTGGTGTGSDPYIIQGWNISTTVGNGITIVGTTAPFEIQSVLIHSCIRGLFFQNTANGGVTSSVLTENQNPVIIDSSANIVINGTAVSDNTFQSSNAAVSITNSTNVTVSANTFSGSYGFYLGYGIRVAHSNIVNINGNRDSLTYGGVFVQYSSMVTVSHNNILGSNGGIDFSNSGNSTVSYNDVPYIFAKYSVTISIIGNTSGGIDLTTSSSSTVSSNTLLGGGLILGWDSGTHNVLPNNTVKGKPLLYYKDCTGTNIDGVPVGQLIMIGCQGVRIANLQITNTSDAIYLSRVRGALLLNNNISNNTWGIKIESSSYLTIVGNAVKSNFAAGINFAETASFQTSGPSIGNGYVKIIENSLTRNECGVCGLDVVSSFLLYHNNFLNNTQQVTGGGTGPLDNGYPSGGNYWSDYTGVDNCSGPAQNICPSPDGIGDTTYGSWVGLQDRYPLMKPYSAPADTIAPTWPTSGILATSGLNSTSVTLGWPNATDDVEVMAYRISMGATVVAYIPGQYHSYTITRLSAGTTYTFNIVAGDAADLWSQNAVSATVTTPNPILTILLISLGLAGVSTVLAIWWLRRRQHVKTAPSPTPTKEGSIPRQFFTPTNRQVEFTAPSPARTRPAFAQLQRSNRAVPLRQFPSF